jgi:hypothetical protein
MRGGHPVFVGMPVHGGEKKRENGREETARGVIFHLYHSRVRYHLVPMNENNPQGLEQGVQEMSQVESRMIFGSLPLEDGSKAIL